MRFSKRLILFALVLAIAGAQGCSDETTVEPPEPAPQITVVATYKKNIDPTKGLQSNDVFDIYVDQVGKIWIGTFAGVTVFDGNTREAGFDQNNGLPNPKCRSLLEYNGKLWVATWGGGVGVYNMTSGTWSILNRASGLTNNQVADIDLYDDVLYFATAGGVSKYVDDEGIPMAERWSAFGRVAGDSLLDEVVSVVEVVSTPRGVEAWYGPSGDAIEIGHEDEFGITVERESVPRPIYYTIVNSDLPEPRVNDILYDAGIDEFWIAFETKGLARVDVTNSRWTVYTMADGLPSDIVHSIALIDDVIWVGTQNGLARQLSSGKFRGYRRSGGLPADQVRKVYADPSGRLWLGFMDGGVARVDTKSAE